MLTVYKTRRGGSRAWSRVMLLLMPLLAWGALVWSAQPTDIDESQIRAAMLFNLTNFVDWPAAKMGDVQMPFVVGYVGGDAVGVELNNLLRGKQVQGKSISLQHVINAAQVTQCHILYVANSGRKQYKEMAPELSRYAVLIVSERQLGDSGIVIGLPLVDSSIEIQVDLKMAQNNGLTISSKLLRIAVVTR